MWALLLLSFFHYLIGVKNYHYHLKNALKFIFLQKIQHNLHTINFYHRFVQSFFWKERPL